MKTFKTLSVFIVLLLIATCVQAQPVMVPLIRIDSDGNLRPIPNAGINVGNDKAILTTSGELVFENGGSICITANKPGYELSGGSCISFDSISGGGGTGDPSTWSQYSATQNINAGGNSLVNVDLVDGVNVSSLLNTTLPGYAPLSTLANYAPVSTLSNYETVSALSTTLLNYIGTGDIGSGLAWNFTTGILSATTGTFMTKPVYDADDDNAVDVTAGGTGSTTAAGARSALGLSIGGDVQEAGSYLSQSCTTDGYAWVGSGDAMVCKQAPGGGDTNTALDNIQDPSASNSITMPVGVYLKFVWADGSCVLISEDGMSVCGTGPSTIYSLHVSNAFSVSGETTIAGTVNFPGLAGTADWSICLDATGEAYLCQGGVGDMTKAVYDVNDNGVVDTAEILASNGTNCSAGSIPLGIDAQGNAEGCYSPSALETALEAFLDLQDQQGAVTDGQVPASFTRDTEWDSLAKLPINFGEGLSSDGNTIDVSLGTAYTGSFSGAVIYVDLTGTMSLSDGVADYIDFTDELYDTGDWANIGSDPTRLTVPDGVSHVVLSLQAYISGTGTTSFDLKVNITKNGSPALGGAGYYRYDDEDNTTLDRYINIETAPLEVSPGDYFQVNVEWNDTGGSSSATLNGDNSGVQTWFAARDVDPITSPEFDSITIPDYALTTTTWGLGPIPFNITWTSVSLHCYSGTATIDFQECVSAMSTCTDITASPITAGGTRVEAATISDATFTADHEMAARIGTTVGSPTQCNLSWEYIRP